MPTLVTRGSISADGFGFASKTPSSVLAGTTFTSTGNNSTGYNQAQGVCSDGAGNIYVTGVDLTSSFSGKFYLAKVNSSGTVVWAYTPQSANISNAQVCSCTYYNGNIYLITVILSTIYVYVVPSSGSTSVTRYSVSLTNSNFGNGVGIFCDGSGNFYISGQGFDSTGTYSALYWVKLTSSFTITASKSFYIANSSWKFVSDGVPAQGGDYSLSTCLYYSGASPSEVLFITVNSSGTAVNSYSFQPSTGATIYGSKTADAYGNTYTLLNGTSGYIVAQNSSGTVLWQNSVTGFGFNTGGSGYLLTDGVSLWVSNGNAGSSHVGSFSALTGSLKWAKAYSSLTNYEFQCGTFSSGNPVFAGSSNAGAVSNFTSPTASTGNTNGTYGGNTVSTVTPTVTASSITATSQTIASSTFSNSAPTTTTGVTLYAYTFASTNGASMTI